MEKRDAISAMAALAHAGRLEIFRLLVRHTPQAVAAGAIADALETRPTTISNQLAELERVGLIRSERRGRSVLYRADIARAGDLVGFLVEDCCRGRPEACRDVASRPLLNSGRNPRNAAQWEETVSNSNRRYRALFICTANSARSIFAEAIMNRYASDRFEAFSAGSAPAEALHPRAVHLLKTLGHDIGALRPKSWREFAEPGSAPLDFVFTVCNRAADEECPVWSGQPMTAHWGMVDPAKATGTEAELGLAFSEAYRFLYHRITAFAQLPLTTLDTLSLQREIDAIGGQEPAADDQSAFRRETV